MNKSQTKTPGKVSNRTKNKDEAYKRGLEEIINLEKKRYEKNLT
jgi:hypothetical protein